MRMKTLLPALFSAASKRRIAIIFTLLGLVSLLGWSLSRMAPSQQTVAP